MNVAVSYLACPKTLEASRRAILGKSKLKRGFPLRLLFHFSSKCLSLDQWVSNLSAHQSHPDDLTKHQLLSPTPRFLQVGPESLQEQFLGNRMPRFENCWCRLYMSLENPKHYHFKAPSILTHWTRVLSSSVT